MGGKTRGHLHRSIESRQTGAQVTWKRREKRTWLVVYEMPWNAEPVSPGGQCRIWHQDHADRARAQQWWVCRVQSSLLLAGTQFPHSRVSAGTLRGVSADLSLLLLYQKIFSAGLEFCPFALPANLVQACFFQFLGKGNPHLYR